jgi:putative glycosyltransferase (TIGR04372 family)
MIIFIAKNLIKIIKKTKYLFFQIAKNLIKIINKTSLFFFQIEICNLINNPNYSIGLMAQGFHSDRKMFYIFLASEYIIKIKIFFFKKFCKNNILILDYLDFLAIILWLRGKFNSSLETFDEQEKYRYKIKNYYLKNGIIKKKIVNYNYYLPRNTIDVLGLIGHLDAIIKYTKIKNIKYTLNLIGDSNRIINNYFFNLYKKYINFIEIKKFTPEELLLEKINFKNWHWVMPSLKKHGKLQLCHQTFSEVLLKWHKKNLGPLINITNKENNIEQIKRKLNIPKKNEYIVLHLRSRFYEKNNKKEELFRSSNIIDFKETINYLNSLGYYVLFMGGEKKDYVNKIKFNKSMFINYSQSSVRSDKNDVIIIKNCKFFIGSNSGPHWIASSLYKKICLINVPFNRGFPYYIGCSYLPVKYIKNDKLINIENILRDYSYFNFDSHFKNNGIRLQNNSSKEILLTIKEFLSDQKIIKKIVFYKDHTERINLFNKKFKYFNHKYDVGINGKISSSYIINNY